MYGGASFVHQWVWPNNEDDVSLDNKPCGVMGIDALTDNIISAEYPDDDKESFDANKFLDLNKYTDPNMGLNCWSRQY